MGFIFFIREHIIGQDGGRKTRAQTSIINIQCGTIFPSDQISQGQQRSIDRLEK